MSSSDVGPGGLASTFEWHHSKCLELHQIPTLCILEMSQSSWYILPQFPKGTVPPLLQICHKDFCKKVLCSLCVANKLLLNQHPSKSGNNVDVSLLALLQGLLVVLV